MNDAPEETSNSQLDQSSRTIPDTTVSANKVVDYIVEKFKSKATIIVAIVTLFGTLGGTLGAGITNYASSKLTGENDINREFQDKLFQIVSDPSVSMDQKQLQVNLLLQANKLAVNGMDVDSLPHKINELFHNSFEWHGYVFKENSEIPIAGARVVFDSDLPDYGSKSTFTDQDGYFSVYQFAHDGKAIQEINYSLYVSKPGYLYSSKQKQIIQRGRKLFYPMYLTSK